MSLTEQTRLRLHQFLEERMGHDLATEIMEWLPRGDLATKDDIEALRLATKADIEGLRAEMKAEFALVRAENALASEKTRADLHNTMRLHTIVLIGALGTMISIARIF